MKTQNILTTLHLSLLNIDYCCVQSWNFRNVISPFTRIYLIKEGEGCVFHNHKKYVLQADHLYMIPGFTRSNYSSESFLGHYYIHVATLIAGGLNIFGLLNFEYELPSTDEDHHLIKKLLQLNPGRKLQNIDPCKYAKENLVPGSEALDFSCKAASYIETQGLLLQLFSRFIKNDSKNSFHSDFNLFKQINQAVDFIHQNLDKHITIGELADICHLSDAYFSRLFLRIMGARPLDYINRKKMESSQLMLITSDDPVEKIALETGIENFSYFNRLFKKYSGITPGEYRRLHRLV